MKSFSNWWLLNQKVENVINVIIAITALSLFGWWVFRLDWPTIWNSWMFVATAIVVGLIVVSGLILTLVLSKISRAIFVITLIVLLGFAMAKEVGTWTAVSLTLILLYIYGTHKLLVGEYGISDKISGLRQEIQQLHQRIIGLEQVSTLRMNEIDNEDFD